LCNVNLSKGRHLALKQNFGFIVGFPQELRKLLKTSEIVAALIEVGGNHISVPTIDIYEKLNNHRGLDRWRSMFCDAAPKHLETLTL